MSKLRRRLGILCVIAAAAGLTACGTERYPSEIPASALEVLPSYDEVCLLESSHLTTQALTDALESGLRATGANVRFLPAGEGPMACPFVITYDIKVRGPRISEIYLQTFEHGVPIVDARGAAREGAGLTTANVAEYAARVYRFAQLYDRARIEGKTAPVRLPAGG